MNYALTAKFLLAAKEDKRSFAAEILVLLVVVVTAATIVDSADITKGDNVEKIGNNTCLQQRYAFCNECGCHQAIGRSNIK